jgi:hypothetical protein
MNLTDSARSERVHGLMGVLTSACEGSVCVPIGSIGRGDADIYSDIDLEWRFRAGRRVGLDEVAATLAQVAPVESIRYDPNYDRLPDARLVVAPVSSSGVQAAIRVRSLSRSFRLNRQSKGWAAWL